LLLIVLGVVTSAALAEDQLPSDPAPDSFEIEPQLLIPPAAEPSQPATADVTRTPPPTLPQLEAHLDRAKKAAADAQHFYKIGVLAKVEAEQRALFVVRFESDLANARREEANRTRDEQQRRFEAGEISKAELDKAASVLAEAVAAAERATAERKRAELEAAALNLKRQQKLLAAGVGHKTDVTRAEEKLTALKQENN
jgi:hypothetical protein